MIVTGTAVTLFDAVGVGRVARTGPPRTAGNPAPERQRLVGMLTSSVLSNVAPTASGPSAPSTWVAGQRIGVRVERVVRREIDRIVPRTRNVRGPLVEDRECDGGRRAQFNARGRLGRRNPQEIRAASRASPALQESRGGRRVRTGELTDLRPRRCAEARRR